MSTSTFIHFRSKSDVGRCLIGMRARSSRDVDFAARWARTIANVVQTYHAPVADIAGANDVLYVLLSRECGEKPEVIKNMFAIANRIPQSKSDMTIDFHPDAEAFLHRYAHG